MDKIEGRFKEIRAFCRKHADPAVVKKYARYFNEGYDAYGLTQEILEGQRAKWLEAWRDEMSMDDYLALGGRLIASGKYEEASFAITFVSCQQEKLRPEMLQRFGSWLEKGVVNWAHCDVLCGRLLAPLLNSGRIALADIEPWARSASVWKRRAVPVTLVEALKTGLPLERILAAVEPLMEDPAHKVQQGLGWLLREAWKLHPAETERFLLQWKESCGRTIVQYATEKMSKERKARFRRSKPSRG
jgi:3-methyladenine DNA glycosylase AlkD